jgi:hypothetical protein
MEGRIRAEADDPERLARQVERWRAAGATHLSVDTMRAGHSSVDDHLAALATVASVVGLSASGSEA